MSLRPVDLQVLLPRAQEANQIHNNVNQNAVSQQQAFSRQLRDQVEQEQQVVLQTSQTENPNVDADGKGNGGYGGNKRKKHPRQAEIDKKAAAAMQAERPMIDISV